MECVLEVSQEPYAGIDSPLMRLFDTKNDRLHLERDEDYDVFVSTAEESTEEEKEDEDRELLCTSCPKKLEAYLTETESVIKRVRFLWNL